MKNLFLFPLILLFVISGCDKDPVPGTNPISTQPSITSPTPPPIPPTLPTNVNPGPTSPNAFAGVDVYIVFPENSYLLKGSAQFPEDIQTILWSKVAGPVEPLIETPNSFETKVSNLEKGIYEFELTITDKAGLIDKDTVAVFILNEGSGKNELLFKDLQWVCPMGCHIRIENFHYFVPTGTAFKAYLKRDHSNQWVEVMNMSQHWSKYMWTIYNKGLEILEDQTEHPNDTPDIKIIF
jgi:hypothetical protein